MATIVAFDPVLRALRPDLPAEGVLKRADSPKGKPITLVVSYTEALRLDNLRRDNTITVTDLWQREQYIVRRAACGEGCFCALMARRE